MSQVKRLYVEKKSSYAVKAKELAEELKAYLSIEDVSDVRELIRYDVQNVSAETMKKAAVTVFSEPPVDDLYEEDFPKKDGDKVFSVEFLPGQFDQRADSAVQCLQLLDEKEEPIIRSATTYVFSGNISDEELEKIKEYCINPVDSREADEKKPETLVMDYCNGRVLQMLKNEERIAEVKRRIGEKERQQRLRHRRIVSAFCIAACLAVIVGVSFVMPGIVGQIEPGASSGFETAATILGGGTALGYMVIGLLAFILGVCVTVLCFRIRQLDKEEQTEEQKGDNGDGADQ